MTEDHEKRTEKYRLFKRHAQHVTIDPMKRVEPIAQSKVHDSGSSSDSGAWIQASRDLEFTHKTFNDPKNTSSDKENSPIIDTWTTPTLNDLNVTEDELLKRPANFVGLCCSKCVLKWPTCICLDESDWEDNATRKLQMPLPTTSSPYPDCSDKDLDKLETEAEDKLDQIHYRARPANDRRLPKPT